MAIYDPFSCCPRSIVVKCVTMTSLFCMSVRLILIE